MRILLVLILVIAGCSYIRKDQPEGARVSREQLEAPDFKVISGAFFDKKCVTCHSLEGGNRGNTNLEGYSKVRAKLARIEYRALVTKDMPPGGLSDSEQNLLERWLEIGAPEEISGGWQKPDPALGTGPYDWELMSSKIFQPKCVACHSSDPNNPNLKPAGDLDLTDIKQAREKSASMLDTVAKQTMPPAPFPALSPQEREAIFHWYESGAP